MQLRGAERVDLAGDLGTDRSASTGDEHPAAMDEVRDRGGVGLHNRTPEQVGFVDLADVAESHTATDKLGDRRQNEHVDVCRGTALGEVVDEAGVRAGDGDDEGAGTGRGGDLLKVESRTADVDALKAQVLAVRGVVEERDSLVVGVRVTAGGAGDLFTRITGAEEDDRGGGGGGLGEAFAEVPVDCSGGQHDCNGDSAAGDGDGAGNGLRLCE